ncbi:MAG: CoA pyrophosphatase, partial [Ignavibacteria bacterium]|nr:CoA pyrophosphatase [Ignavibacteria bacterium]
MKNLTVDNIAASLKTAPEILGKDKYFNSAVLIPLFEKENELHVLFEKRATTIRQGGEVSFPGGEFDRLADKSLEETAIRETTEELRIEKDKIIFLGRFGTLVAPMGVAVDAFSAYLEIEN